MPQSVGSGAAFLDYDNDGRLDIFLIQDGGPDSKSPHRLFHQEPDGKFKDVTVGSGLDVTGYGRGVAVGDINNDGLFDIYMTHLTEENNCLWIQGPRGQFQDRTAKAELATTAWHGTGFGTLLMDFDNDGFLDLAFVNGRVRRPSNPNAPTNFVASLGPHWSVYGERNQLFTGDGTGKFKEISVQNPTFCGTPTVGRGLASGDIDNDGAVDLLVSAISEPARLYHNIAPKRGHWLTVRVIEPALGGRDAYGAQVTIQTVKGPRMGLACPSFSFASSSDPRVHFGLGEISRIEMIQVVWPEGETEEFPGTSVDQVLVLRKAEGKK